MGLQHWMHYHRWVSFLEPVGCYVAGIVHSQEVHVADGLHMVYFDNVHTLQAVCAGPKMI